MSEEPKVSISYTEKIPPETIPWDKAKVYHNPYFGRKEVAPGKYIEDDPNRPKYSVFFIDENGAAQSVSVSRGDIPNEVVIQESQWAEDIMSPKEVSKAREAVTNTIKRKQN